MKLLLNRWHTTPFFLQGKGGMQNTQKTHKDLLDENATAEAENSTWLRDVGM